MKRPQLRTVGFVVTTALSLAFGGASEAATASGSFGGSSWSARNLIVGQNSTAITAAGGNPLYFAPMPQYSGVASLIMNYQNGSSICTGSLLPDRVSLLSAAHCFAPDASTGALLSTTAYFYGGANPDTIVHTSPFSTAVPVANIFLHPEYTGAVIDQHDVAVLRLSNPAPSFATAYGLSSATGLTGQDFNVAGYGRRSNGGGSVGANLGTGVLRQGDNRFDFRFGDDDFGGGWAGIVGDLSITGLVYLADFDNGLSARDSSCLTANAFFITTDSKYCDVGRGASEVSVAGGDSGGPQFDSDYNVMSVTSFILSFGQGFGDVDTTINSSWGEFGGYAPVYANLDFIQANLYPAPGPLPISGVAVMLHLRRRLRRRRGGTPS